MRTWPYWLTGGIARKIAGAAFAMLIERIA
jgi:hypothetical protein